MSIAPVRPATDDDHVAASLAFVGVADDTVTASAWLRGASAGPPIGDLRDWMYHRTFPEDPPLTREQCRDPQARMISPWFRARRFATRAFARPGGASVSRRMDRTRGTWPTSTMPRGATLASSVALLFACGERIEGAPGARHGAGRPAAAEPAAGASSATPPAPPRPLARRPEPPEPRPAVLLIRAAHPVPHGHAARSFFGGRPHLPPHLPWPVVTRDGRDVALTFIAQIDLTELPALAERELLPKTGTLYYFVDSEYEGVGAPIVRVLYFSGDARALAAADPPPNLMLMSGTGLRAQLPFVAETEPDARVGFKLPLSFATFTTHWWTQDGPIEEFDRAEAAEDASIVDAIGPRLVSRRDVRTRRERLEPGNDLWPWSWLQVEYVARAARLHLTDAHRLASSCAEWEQAARRHPPDSVPSPEERQRLREWWRSLVLDDDAARVVHRLSAASAYAGLLHAARHPDTFDRLPADIVAALAMETAYIADDLEPQQLLGYGMSVQLAGHDHARDVLLLQVAGGGLAQAWMSPDCALQYWIAPEDLVADRFDAAFATLECS